MTPADRRRRVHDLLTAVHDLVQTAPSVDGISDSVLKLSEAVGELAVLTALYDPPPPVQLYRCSSPNCPGYPYKASDFAHPASTCGQPEKVVDVTSQVLCSRCGSPYHWGADCPYAPAPSLAPVHKLLEDLEQRIRCALSRITWFETADSAGADWKSELRAILYGRDARNR